MPALTPPIALVGDLPKAGVLLKPIRLQVLAEARTPASATSIAATLGLSRQQVNYHVRALARAGFLRRAGRQRKRGLVEQKYVVSAQAFLLAPDVLGPLGPTSPGVPDKTSATYLLMLGAQLQREVGTAWRESRAQNKRLPILALDSEVRFTSAEQRARFADALTAAMTRVIAEHSSPATLAGGATRGRPYRLMLGCYPSPTPQKERRTDPPHEEAS